MLIKYQISNTYKTTTAQTVTVSGGTFIRSKSIVLPISTDFFPVDYGEDIQDIVVAERKKAINPIVDLETIKYTFPKIDSNSNLIINFRFWNTSTSSYTTDYKAAGFTEFEISKNRNNFKRSFFRLYFYDSNSGETNNLLFTEDINVYKTEKAELIFDRLYWLRNDKLFISTNDDRTVYMNASFFNAKTGKVIKFINPSGPPTTSLLTIQQYGNPVNRDWRTSAITIKNPKNNNGLYNFVPTPNFGANLSSTITLSEFILI